MPILSPADLTRTLDRLDRELNRRAGRIEVLDRYVGTEDNCPLPDAIIQARVTKAYRLLMGMASAPWGSLVVGAVTDRLIPTGLKSDQNDKADLDALWGVWQDNQLDADALLAHDAALTHGRAVALVWPQQGGPQDGTPRITIDRADQLVVEYAPGSRRERTGACRRWVDESGRRHWTLYTPDFIYKFSEEKSQLRLGGAGSRYARRETPGEPWPLPNRYGVVPAVDLPVNGKLQAGTFPYARGEFEHCIGLLDRINMLTFLGLVVAFWQGFPIRAVIGDKIKREVLKDDDGNALLEDDGVTKRTRQKPPFEATADGVVQFENPQTRLESFPAADRKALSIYGELDQFGSITQTPRYYFPLEGGMVNLSAEAIVVTDGGLESKMPKHQGSLGEGWEETLRVAGLMLPSPVILSPRAELQWAPHEHRSLAEMADAAAKLAPILPMQMLAAKVLNLSQQEIDEIAGASPAVARVVSEVTNGNGTSPLPV